MNEEKARHDYEEDMRYASENELLIAVKFAVKEGHMSEERAHYLLTHKEEGFHWLFKEGR